MATPAVALAGAAITATNLRKDLFRHLDAVAAGQELEVSHKGMLLRIVRATPGSRLARLVVRDEVSNIEPGDSGWESSGAKAAWEKEADEFFGSDAGSPKP